MEKARKKFNLADNFSEIIINRLKNIYKFRHDSELCELLEISGSTLASWRTRNYIDFQRIFALLPDLDFNYLLKGEDEKYKSNSDKANIIKEPEVEYNATKAEIKNNEIIIHIKLDNGLVISKKNNNNPIEKDLKY